MVTVRKAMTRKVISFRPNDTLGTVVKRFSKHHISGAPVVEKEKVVGMVSESDIIKTIDAYDPKIHFDDDSSFAVVTAFLKHKREFDALKKEILGSEKVMVVDFMTTNVITIKADEPIEEAARLINKHDVKRLPVVDSKGKLLGLISRANIIRALGK